jgi:hypothetical protein
MPQTSRFTSAAARPTDRRCAANCGRAATVVSAGRRFCATCYGIRRTRLAAKSGGSRL